MVSYYVVAVTEPAREQVRIAAAKRNGPVERRRFEVRWNLASNPAHEGSKGTYVTRKLLSFCDGNRGWAVTVCGPGDRAPGKKAAKFLLPREGALPCDQSIGCAAAALVNGVGCMLGTEKARKAYGVFLEETPYFVRLRDAHMAMQKLKNGLKASKEKQKTLDEGETWEEFLVAKMMGVYVVRVLERSVMDHMFAVDCGTQLIWDSAERHPMKLCYAALEACDGDEAAGAKMIEVAKLEEYERKKGSKKPRTSD